MSTDLLAFSDMVETHFPTVEAYVLHVRAHERQADGTTKDRISFAEFKDQEGRLK